MITFLRRRSKQAALTAFAVIAACDSPVNSDPDPNGVRAGLLDSLPISLGDDSVPGTVSDLAVSGLSDTSATLTFTEVDDGTGHPASYDVRSAVAPIAWGSAQSVTHGTCSTPVAGTTVGARHTCVVSSLTPGTNYQFQLVAYRGTLDVNAVFGGLSNVASGTTPLGSPGTVSDLTVTAMTDTSATLGFTEVDDGTGKPASYDVRSAVSPISWGSARSRAETMPVVSDQSRPNGLPMANTFCPTLRSALAPIGSGGGRR